ncbi:four helix bundle protein [Chryseobacterium sp. SSA4.19]|uniref:four helix bundle protein n=1 Tax=Chryseobacterium sp. SSA4.19 TaxID=2919915 RepID=UPI001F4E184C|nr:four helix bundle protein [Chryseobacterium sp. SSA4.19]MCJ8155529.1 four helix bundle protein [Chryseobacterium sp. SSA4.19]
MHNFRELEVWKKSILLCKQYYIISKSFPKDELFGLTSQSRRSLYSVPSNIAEGAGRDNNPQFCQFLNIALGSSFEFETQIIIANDLGFVNKNDFELLMKEIRHIQNMIVKLKQIYSK